jgi:polyisoprenyl-phosphate glycosyltransferase
MDTNKQLDVSVVIPVYGSASILPQLVARLQEVLEPAFGLDRYEAVLVHDCGPDNSWHVIEGLAKERPWLVGIDLRKNAGQHNAIMAGLGIARGRCIVTMDDDLQHDPADVSRIVDKLREGFDLCYVQFERRQHVLWKRAGSWFNDLVARRLLKKPKGLYLSPFRGMLDEVRDEVLRYEGPFVYVDGLLLQSTSSIATISARHHSRSNGKSGYSLKKSVSLWMQMATSFSVTPLRFVSIAGICASFIGFLLAIVVVVKKLSTPDLAVGWASLIVAILMMGGLQLLGLGVIGEYTGRVLLSLNRRPQYLIRRSVNVGARVTDDQVAS